MKCGTVTCDREAGFGFMWPGREPQAACLMCWMRAKTIAKHMGFTLHDIRIEEIERKLALESIEMVKGGDL
jgi:hypothetical protein